MDDGVKRRWMASTAMTRRSMFAGALASPVFLYTAPGLALSRDHDPDVSWEVTASARPRVWWHWMDGNVALEGISRDLEWMKRVGVGGVQVFDGALHTPQVVAERVPYLSPAWRTAMKHAVTEAENLDLEFTIASSPGWSETGGPWVRPEQAMKKLVWSEVDVVGGAAVSLRLPDPPAVTGPFQDMPGGGAEPSEPPPPDLPQLYRDARVVAYRVSTVEPPSAVVTATSPIDPRRLLSGGRTDVQRLEVTDGVGWIDFAHDRPMTMRAVELVLQPGPRVGPIYPSWPAGRIEASDDGRTYRTVAVLPERGAPQQTVAFPAATAKHFRLVLEPRFAPFPVKAFAPPEQHVAAHGIARLRFLSEARVHRFEDKAGWSSIAGLDAAGTPVVSPSAVIRPEDVIDLTPRMTPDGRLDWTPPRGTWRIIRMGWSLTGKLNNPASAEGTGLEVDKLNGAHVKAYLDAYLALYEAAVGPENLGAQGVRYVLNDSYEAMPANWTEDILDRFEALRGYDPTPWLPVLAGRVVGAADQSDRFLWDFRRTLGDLIADEHYGVLSRELKMRGLGRYGEAHEALRAFVGDGMEVKKTADVPMGATWAMEGLGRRLPDLLESASVAHLYGQNVVAAESFTAIAPAYGFDPAALRPIADRMMANGVNRFVIHISVHQPDDRPGPGVTLGPVGQWFTRKETWADMAGAWISYLARSSELLQRGRFVADVALFYGEDDNLTAVYADREPAIPDGHAFDFVNADALRSLLDVKDGRLVAPSGAAYRILALDPAARRVTLPTLQRMDALSRRGLVIAGARPEGSPALADDEAAVARLIEAIWSRPQTFRSLEEAIQAVALAPDVILDNPQLAFVHRASAREDIYFIANLGDLPATTRASFRVTGRRPEIWRADEGSTRPAEGEARNGRTEVNLSLAPHEAVFVVFREPTRSGVFRAPQAIVQEMSILEGPWRVQFPTPHSPTELRLERLMSWSGMASPEIRHFSGVARYSQTLQSPVLAPGQRLMLDLGRVENLAEVLLNGEPVGVAWKPPYRVDLTTAVRPGLNELEIAVANLWPNRLIGDRQAGSGQAPVLTTYNPFSADSPLQEAGLLGPVRLLLQWDATG